MEPPDTDVGLASLPVVPPGSRFTFPVIDELHPKPDVLEFVYVDSLAAVRWCEATWDGEHLQLTQAVSYSPRGYRVVVFLAPALVAAIDGGNILHWLKVEKGKLLTAFAPRRLNHTANAVFLAHRPQSHEVIVLFDDGTAMRVTKP